MRVIVQPRDGIEPLLQGIREARQSVEIVIYRLDRLEIEQALIEAAWRGVRVHALTTYTNREDLKEIKKLEKRLTDAGVLITRTAEDLVRYHSKVMIIDRRRLFLLTFNFTFLDIHHSRSFGVVTEDPLLVHEAIGLFEADTLQINHVPEAEPFVVSPVNARKKLSAFIQGAERQLLIYDDKLSDAQMIRHLEERARAGVEIKVIGSLNKHAKGITVRKMPQIRLHVQAIIRDGRDLFFGSQSLRKVELDQRREVGLITAEPAAVEHFRIIFELDWGDIIL
ncbi:MAG: phosphatidylserine synthase [Acidobacteria bacterium]|nr:phosphatidylserine synthase [Acidobacteriota bacterium]MBI3422287.1 phosphatidylserine synthase [Acidobacteriota bacterium]